MDPGTNELRLRAWGSHTLSFTYRTLRMSLLLALTRTDAAGTDVSDWS